MSYFDTTMFLMRANSSFAKIASAANQIRQRGRNTERILDFGALKIDLPSGLLDSVPYLYFQAPEGQCFQLRPIDEDQAYYKSSGDGSNAASAKEADAVKEKAMHRLAQSHHRSNRNNAIESA
jgi:hypothetical protein